MTLAQHIVTVLSATDAFLYILITSESDYYI